MSNQKISEESIAQRVSERTESDVKAERSRIMAEFGITYSGNAFHLQGYRYERLADAVNYAQLRREGIAS